MLLNNGKICVTINIALNILEYYDPAGRSPFRGWFNNLNSDAAGKVTTALYRLGLGNFANVKGVGSGVYESRINFGPGYRVYFGKDGEELVILLAGGTKKKQSEDIQAAIRRWQDYKRRKKEQRERN